MLQTAARLHKILQLKLAAKENFPDVMRHVVGLSRSTLIIDVGVQNKESMLRNECFQLCDHATNTSLPLNLQGKSNMFRRSIAKIQGQVLQFYVRTRLSMKVLAPMDAFLEEKRNMIRHTVGP